MEFTNQKKIVLANKYNRFKEEIELAMIQNCIVECELYSIIAEIIRGTENGKEISLRDVTARKRTELSKNLEGEAGFPDFVVLERKKSRDAARYGCIEAKRPYDNMEITEQIEGHLNSYGKVIYTNGLVWKFYKEKKENEKVYILGSIKSKNKQAIIWEPLDNWYKLMSFLEDWNWKS